MGVRGDRPDEPFLLPLPRQIPQWSQQRPEADERRMEIRAMCATLLDMPARKFLGYVVAFMTAVALWGIAAAVHDQLLRKGLIFAGALGVLAVVALGLLQWDERPRLGAIDAQVDEVGFWTTVESESGFQYGASGALPQDYERHVHAKVRETGKVARLVIGNMPRRWASDERADLVSVRLELKGPAHDALQVFYAHWADDDPKRLVRAAGGESQIAIKAWEKAVADLAVLFDDGRWYAIDDRSREHFYRDADRELAGDEVQLTATILRKGRTVDVSSWNLVQTKGRLIVKRVSRPFPLHGEH